MFASLHLPLGLFMFLVVCWPINNELNDIISKGMLQSTPTEVLLHNFYVFD